MRISEANAIVKNAKSLNKEYNKIKKYIDNAKAIARENGVYIEAIGDIYHDANEILTACEDMREANFWMNNPNAISSPYRYNMRSHDEVDRMADMIKYYRPGYNVYVYWE